MIITCALCKKVYDIPEERLRLQGSSVAFYCQACGNLIEIKLPGKGADGPPPKDSLVSGDALKKRILMTVEDLPPMPQVAQKARQVIANERSSFRDLARIIETDQAIATRVLKMANSSYYGLVSKVTSIQHAAALLGMKTLNDLLIFACAGTLLEQELLGYGLMTGDLWKHSLATAGCARSLAAKKRPHITDDAFTTGLIHDCGKIILDPYIAERHDRFMAFLEPEGTSFLDAEKELLGFDHAEIASEVCRKWHIPENMTLAIQAHHKPSLAGGDELAHIVHAADAIALMTGIGSGIDGMKYEIDVAVMESLELNSNEIGLHMASALEFVEEALELY